MILETMAITGETDFTDNGWESNSFSFFFLFRKDIRKYIGFVLRRNVIYFVYGFIWFGEYRVSVKKRN